MRIIRITTGHVESLSVLLVLDVSTVNSVRLPLVSPPESPEARQATEGVYGGSLIFGNGSGSFSTLSAKQRPSRGLRGSELC